MDDHSDSGIFSLNVSVIAELAVYFYGTDTLLLPGLGSWRKHTGGIQHMLNARIDFGTGARGSILMPNQYSEAIQTLRNRASSLCYMLARIFF